MEHHKVLRKVDEVLENFKEMTASNFGFSAYRDASGKKNRCFDMDWEGFYMLAMSCSGPKAMRARRELVVTVRNAMRLLDGRRPKILEEYFVLREMMSDVARFAGRALNRYKPIVAFRRLEQNGQEAFHFPVLNLREFTRPSHDDKGEDR